MPATRSSTISSVTDLLEKTAAPGARPKATGGAHLPVSPVDIEALKIGKRFGETRVFSDVSFRLARGEAVALVGANGTGKSTLLRCMMGLIPASQGKVVLLGEEATGAKMAALRALRARIGLVSQKHNLVPRLSVLSNVTHGLLGRHPGLRHWSHTFAPAPSRTAAMRSRSSESPWRPTFILTASKPMAR